MGLTPDDELTDEQRKAQEELRTYSAALHAEFAEKTALEPENVEEITRDFFRKNASKAAATIVWLADNSTSDSVRANASKYVIEAAFKEETESTDPLKKLLNDLTQAGNKTKQKSTAS